ncbi:MAG: DUF3089 domain-containing protein [Myxococcales bacterium]|nr:DUF3089 domain-containing protein [Myxococcales bacterium]MCB9755874.1 DUF3089 domain-containing protein [Myxococcales bacterium]
MAKQRSARSRILRALALIILAGGVAAALTVDRWLMIALDPGPFTPGATPPAPKYSEPTAWAALPEGTDGADVSLPSSPAIDQHDAPAAVFYLHPTTALGRQWNAPHDDPKIHKATARGGTMIQASVFNACCAVYAPYYRQAHGRAFTQADEAGARAIDVAYADVSAAFDEFLARVGDRPFILAGHSQGAVLGARLARERIAGQPLAERLIAAYLPGAPLTAESVGLPVCEGPKQLGCVATWNARGPEYRASALDFAALREPAGALLCVNPLSWTTSDEHVPAVEHAGAVFFDTEAPAVKPAFADARCTGGLLRVTRLGDPERDLKSRALLWIIGPQNYHPIEYQMFYMDIRNNAVVRTGALLH